MLNFYYFWNSVIQNDVVCCEPNRVKWLIKNMKIIKGVEKKRNETLKKKLGKRYRID